MDRKIIVTDDNSKTLLIPELNETYHSTKGAITESFHVFIKNGLSIIDKDEIHIFEMGLGTGLNVLTTLSYLNSCKNPPIIYYTAIEKHPLEKSLISELNYLNSPALKCFKKEYDSILDSTLWDQKTKINSNFIFNKIKGDVIREELVPDTYDIIFYDAFGPKVQPKLWDKSILQKMFEILKCEGVLVTYCAQGQFKRNLKAVGFKVGTLDGPPGKREMVRAEKAS